MDAKTFTNLTDKLKTELRDRIQRGTESLQQQSDAYLSGHIDLTAYLRDGQAIEARMAQDEADLAVVLKGNAGQSGKLGAVLGRLRPAKPALVKPTPTPTPTPDPVAPNQEPTPEG